MKRKHRLMSELEVGYEENIEGNTIGWRDFEPL